MTNTLDETAQKKQIRLEGGTAAPTSGGRLPRWLLFATSFLGGFQIMVLEICGFRVLQTTLGSSVVVTGTLLTIMMVLLSAGYYVGEQPHGQCPYAIWGAGVFGFVLVCRVWLFGCRSHFASSGLV